MFVGVDSYERGPNFREDKVLLVSKLEVVQDLRFIEHVHIAHVVILVLRFRVFVDVAERHSHRRLLVGPTGRRLDLLVACCDRPDGEGVIEPQARWVSMFSWLNQVAVVLLGFIDRLLD